MIWAKTEGRGLYPQLATYFSKLQPFSKHMDPSRPVDRSKIKNLPVIPEPDRQRFIEEEIDDTPMWEQVRVSDMPMWEKVIVTLITGGPAELARRALLYLRWRLG